MLDRLLVVAPATLAVLVDFDGALAPIVDHPDDARVLPAARDALGALVGIVGRVGVVSGRPVRYLVEQLALDGVEYVGQYGAERLVDGHVVVDGEVAAARDAVRAGADDADRSFPDLFVERKGDLAFAVHWRMRPGRDVADEVDALAARHGLVAERARAASEVRPTGAPDKGSAVRTLAHGMRAAMFGGDDRGDLAAFDALDQLEAEHELDAALRVAVSSVEMPSELSARADVHVEGPAGLTALLEDLAAALNARG